MSFRVSGSAIRTTEAPIYGKLLPQIYGIPGFQAWFRADNVIREPGTQRITSWVDLSGSNQSLAQPATASKALLTDNVINKYPAAVFDGDDFYGAGSAGPVVSWSDPWTMVLVGLETGLSPSGHGLMGALVDSNNRSVVYRYGDSGLLKFSHGDAEIVLNAPRGVPHLIVVSNTGGVIRASVDGGPVVRGRGNNAGAGNAPVCLGAFNTAGTGAFQGAVSDFGLFRSDLHTQPIGLGMIYSLGRSAYEIGI